MLNVYRLEQHIAKPLAEHNVPGLALALVHEGAIVYARGFGVASVEERQPITPETLFQIGSTTKPMTGTMIMALVERGVLDLDEPVRRWLPELRLSDPSAAERVTLRMLLSHTAGLPRDQITPTRLYGRRDPEGLAAWARDELPTRPLIAPSGTSYSYSNPSLNLAAHAAEAATGQFYAELMRELVFEPVGMRRTTLDPSIAMTYPHAQAHDTGDDGAPRVVHRVADNVAQYPSAFAWSNVLELARFAMLHLGDGTIDGTRVLARETIAEMHRPQIARDDGSAGHYGLTFMLDTWNGVQRSSHPGGINSFICQFTLIRESRTAVAMLHNHMSDFPSDELVDELCAELLRFVG
jgi:CubicO group peptidase (beta-lactamase class C family)